MSAHLTLQRFYYIRARTQAFSAGQVQTVGVFLQWCLSLGLQWKEIVDFTLSFPAMLELDKVGYFQPVHGPKAYARIKELEKRLPSDFRKEMRKARLANSLFGMFPSGKG